MSFTDQQGFFDFVRMINKKYLKPADENIKFLEEYCGENGINCIYLLKDVYGYLLQAIGPVDIVLNKQKIDMYLKKYINDLQKILVKTQWTLIEVRKADLQKNIHRNDAAKIKKRIELGKAELNKIVMEKKDATECLDSLIECSKIIYDLVKVWCEEYHLA